MTYVFQDRLITGRYDPAHVAAWELNNLLGGLGQVPG